MAVAPRLSSPEARSDEWPADSCGIPNAVSHLLEKLALRYCLLRAPQPETSDTPAGIELTIHPEDRQRLPALIQELRNAGFFPVQRIPLAANDCRYDFATALDADTRFFSITVREIFPSGHLIARDGEILGRRLRKGNFWVLCEADEFCYLLSKISLEGKVSESDRHRLNQLARILRPTAAGAIAGDLFGDGWQEQVLEACAGDSWNGILKQLGAQVRTASYRRAPMGRAVHALLQFRCALRRWYRPNGMYIVLLGPDGSGKSTMTERILKLLGPLFQSCHVMQWRPQILRPRQQFAPGFNPPHTKPSYGTLRSMAHVSAALLDYFVAYPIKVMPFMAHRALIVYDRDFHDLLVDRLRYRYGGPEWFLKVAIGLCPAPETVFLTLDAEPDIILNRKNEVAPEELRRQRKAYADLAARLPNSTLIRTDRSVGASISATSKVLLKYMADRFEARQHAEQVPVPRAAEKSQAAQQEAVEKMPEVSEFPAAAGFLNSFWSNPKSWMLKCSTAMMDHGLISGSNFLLGIVLARYLGSEQYGAFALAFSTFVLLSLIHSALAMEPMSVFAPSIYRKTLPEYLGLLLWLQVAGSVIIVACAGAGEVFFRMAGMQTHLISAFEGIALASPCVLIFWFARRAFYLQFRPSSALIGSIVYSVFLCFGIWVLAAGHRLSPFAAFVVMGTAALLTSLLLLFLLRPAVSEKAIFKVLSMREVVMRHWHYGRWAFASALFIWIPWNSFYSVVTHYSGLAESGTLKALLNLAMPMTQTYAAFSLLFISQAARLGHDKGWDAVKVLAWRIAGLYALGSSVYWILVCLFRNQLINLMYAGHYREMVPLIPVVAVASILSGAAMGPTIAIRAMRSPANVAAIYFGSSLVSLLFGIPACRAWGIRGAVFGILLSSIISVLTGFLMVRSRNLRKRMSAANPEHLPAESVSAGD
jgi:O-antigen/teichoic acid export membrane protein